MQISRGDFLANASHAAEFEEQRQLRKIGKPVDRSEWDMTPPTVNAYYNPQMNDINFPAGVCSLRCSIRRWMPLRITGTPARPSGMN